MNLSRRNFLGGLAAAGAASSLGMGCSSLCCCKNRPGKVAVQLYSIHKYIPTVGLAKALSEVKAIGFEGVEFAGYYNNDPKTLKAMLADNGLVVCGTHVGNNQYGFDTKKWTFNPDVLKKTCAFETAYGNNLIICPGGGNIPPGASWSTGRGGDPVAPSQAIDDFTKKLAEFYNKAAEVAKAEGCKIGLHNHTWEHGIKMLDGTSFWDYFFKNTCKDVCMEQDVGWSTCAGVDPKAQYIKYPGRAPTLHAKENGMGKNVKEFDAILGRPGKPDAVPVDWDGLFPVTDADNVQWYVVECERHFDTLDAIRPSWEFLHSKGRC